MTAIDMLSTVGLIACLLLWLSPAVPRREMLLWIVALGTLTVSAYGALDYRWQLWATALTAVAFLVALGWRSRRGNRAPGGRRWVSASLLALLVVPAVSLLLLFPVHDLPAPAGPHLVGVRDFELADASRPGVLAAPQGTPRRLLVRVWYPASASGSQPRRPYFTDAEAGTTATGIIAAPFFLQYLKHVNTNAFVSAPLLRKSALLPVVVFSHGYASFAGQNTALMEHLASYGYLVFAVQHSYDAYPTLLPNGDVLPMDPALAPLLTEAPPPSAALRQAITGVALAERYAGTAASHAEMRTPGDRVGAISTAVWLADRRFVLDSLERSAVPESVRDVVAAGNYAATGQMGMSFGGAATGAFCMVDPRCVAAVNLDGRDLGAAFAKNIPVPLLMLYTDPAFMAGHWGIEDAVAPRAFNDFSYERPERAGLRDDVYRLSVRNVKHLGMSDFTYFMRNPVRRLLLGGIDGATMLRLQNDLVLGFFDKHLRARDANFPAVQLSAYREHLSALPIDDVRQWWLAEHPEDQTQLVSITTPLGEIAIALYPQRAPLAVQNFLRYVNEGLFEGASLYRVTSTERGNGIDVVQGGLLGDAMREDTDEYEEHAGPLPPIAHELTSGTGISNERGTLSYARLAPGTASSEFFFNIYDNPGLDSGAGGRNPDGQGYTAFGRVMRGLPVLQRIQWLPRLEDAPMEMLKGQLLAEPVPLLDLQKGV